MINMAKAKSMDVWIGVVVLIVVILFATGNLKLNGSSLSVSGTGTSQTTMTSQATGASCNPLPKIQLTAKYYNASANNGAGGFTQVATGYNAFVQGSTTVYSSGGTSKTAVTNVTVGCNQAYTIIEGDNAATWQNGTSVATTTNPLQPVSLVVTAVSTPNLVFKNATSAGYTSGGGKVDSVSNSQVLSAGAQISIQVQSTGAGACYGNPNYALQMSYNSVQVTSVSIPGFSTVSQTLPSEASFRAGASQVAFQIPGPLCNYAVQTINPTFNLGTVPLGIANTIGAANQLTNVGIYLIPQTNTNANGALITGVYVTPGTTTAIGPVTFNSNAIAFGTT